MSPDKLQSLRTLALSDNVDLQKSAALCFSEISDTCTLLVHVHVHVHVINTLHVHCTLASYSLYSVVLSYVYANYIDKLKQQLNKVLL